MPGITPYKQPLNTKHVRSFRPWHERWATVGAMCEGQGPPRGLQKLIKGTAYLVRGQEQSVGDLHLGPVAFNHLVPQLKHTHTTHTQVHNWIPWSTGYAAETWTQTHMCTTEAFDCLCPYWPGFSPEKCTHNTGTQLKPFIIWFYKWNNYANTYKYTNKDLNHLVSQLKHTQTGPPLTATGLLILPWAPSLHVKYIKIFF